MHHIAQLRTILAWFTTVSGLKINLSKSELLPMANVTNLEELVVILDCKHVTLPMKYLGFPLGVKCKEKTIRNPIINRMEKRLARWRHLYLSKKGKVMLIKSTLSSLPNYFLSLFPIPIDVANHIEQLQQIFYGVR